MKKMILAVFAMGMFAFQTAASAESIQGQVTQVNQDAQYFMLNRANAQPGQPQELRISVKQDAEFKGGLNSLGELQTGDQVKVDANQQGANWEAESIEIQEGQAGAEGGQAGRMGGMEGQAGQY